MATIESHISPHRHDTTSTSPFSIRTKLERRGTQSKRKRKAGRLTGGLATWTAVLRPVPRLGQKERQKDKTSKKRWLPTVRSFLLLVVLASNLITSDGLQPRSDGLQKNANAVEISAKSTCSRLEASWFWGSHKGVMERRRACRCEVQACRIAPEKEKWIELGSRACVNIK